MTYADDKGASLPWEMTTQASCPACSSQMKPIRPGDESCETWYCDECGFGEPAELPDEGLDDE